MNDNDIKEIKILLERIANAIELIAHRLDPHGTAHVGRFTDIKDSPPNGINKSEGGGESKNNFINDFSDIEIFLQSKNIKIKNIKEENESDEILDKLAFFMGNRYSHIKTLYQIIKRTLNTGKSFKLDLKNYKQEEIASITQLCTNLHQIAFLEDYKYFKSPQYILYARVNRVPTVINFFTGGWLERYIKTAVIKAIETISLTTPVNYSYLKNPQIVLPGGNDFELDLLFKIENEYFWFEAKTGDYQRSVSKYSEVAKILNLDYGHAFMILTDITDSGAQALKGLFNMNVVKIDKFYEEFKDVAHSLIFKAKDSTSEKDDREDSL